MRATLRMTRSTVGDELELAVDGRHVASTRRHGQRSTAALVVEPHASVEDASAAYRAHVLRALARGFVPVRAERD